jgi:hypothetical protein
MTGDEMVMLVCSKTSKININLFLGTKEKNSWPSKDMLDLWHIKIDVKLTF